MFTTLNCGSYYSNLRHHFCWQVYIYLINQSIWFQLVSVFFLTLSFAFRSHYSSWSVFNVFLLFFFFFFIEQYKAKLSSVGHYQSRLIIKTKNCILNARPKCLCSRYKQSGNTFQILPKCMFYPTTPS